ncbi:MAG: HIT family protein [Candidatus Nanopelagicales bacterium]
MHDGDSRFLAIPESDWVASNELAFAIRDNFPASPGHTLVVPRRLIADWDSATPAEREAILALVDHVKHALRVSHRPDGFNLGINEGVAAGQTVLHLHFHVIPRYTGDVPDPRGGIRHAVTGRGNWQVGTEDWS